MAAYKKPIQRSLLIGCAAFILCLCVLLSAQSYLLFSSALYVRYNTFLGNILTYVENNADTADLAECIETGIPSEEYDRLQRFLNRMIDDFGLFYLYIVIPVDDETGTMVNVVSATSEAERAAGETDMPLLFTTDAYSKATIQRYLKAWNEPGVSYFEESSGYGEYYTACKPLKLPDGETVALVCADLSIEALHRSVNGYVFFNVLLTIVSGGIFGILLLVWLRRNITGPVVELEKSTRRFAEKSHDARDPDQLLFEAPDIHTLNEVESLADAISKMSEDMKDYIRDILSAEGRVRNVEKEVEGITRIAYQDALTHVKNKAACNEKMDELSEEIAKGGAEFAIIMVDLNCLKRVNDTCGHEKGDQYLIGACRIVSDVYKRSPVFRIGGDEFVVILQGEDYRNREKLYRDMEKRFAAAWADTSRDLWERYSAAAGMAVYGEEAGESVNDVLGRADERMYRNKQRMKSVIPARVDS